MRLSDERPNTSYSLQEGASILGLTTDALRRRIAMGDVQADLVQISGHYVWRVYLDLEHPDDGPARVDVPHTSQEGAKPLLGSALTAAPPETLGDLLMAPLAEQVKTIREQAERIGQLTTELEVARKSTGSTHSTHSASFEIPFVEQSAIEPTQMVWARPLTLAGIVEDLSRLTRHTENQARVIARLREENVWRATGLRATQERLEVLEATRISWRQWLSVRNLRALAVIILVTLCILTVLDIVEASAWAR